MAAAHRCVGSDQGLVGAGAGARHRLKWDASQILHAQRSFHVLAECGRLVTQLCMVGLGQVGTEIDWMALPGINITLMYTGQEAVLYHTYGKFGLYLLNKSGMHSDFFDGPVRNAAPPSRRFLVARRP